MEAHYGRKDHVRGRRDRGGAGMRKTLIEGVLDTIIMTVLGFATLWLFRVDGELLVMAMAFGTYGIIGALVFDDWLYKRLKFPKLLNWQDRTGAVMAFVADEAALVAVYSETMPLFRMCSAVSVSFGAGAFVWFWKVYTPSVMKLEQRDLYDRKNYEGSVRRAKTKGKLAKLFSRFLRYQCVWSITRRRRSWRGTPTSCATTCRCCTSSRVCHAGRAASHTSSFSERRVPGPAARGFLVRGTHAETEDNLHHRPCGHGAVRPGGRQLRTGRACGRTGDGGL